MAKQTVKVTKKTKRRVKKSSLGGAGYKVCNMCHGTGRVKR